MQLTLFRDDVNVGTLESAMTLYPGLINAGLMGEHESRELTRLLLNSYRNNLPANQAAKEALHDHAETIVRDYRGNLLPPHPVASLHLLSYFKTAQKYDDGVEFWAWLKRQDERYADARTYGAAIELLACYGESLQNLEALYIQAMKRFPGDFVEYHLSPEAIVPDRTKPLQLSGASLSLLQGILTARLLHGDWRNAYLALDTSLRLYLDQVPGRVFELFVYERPLSEGYRVFLLACRSGNTPKSNLFTLLLDGLADLQSPASDTADNVATSAAMLNAFRAFVGAGGAPSVHHLNALTRGLLGMLYASPGLSECDDGIVDKLSDECMGAIRQLSEAFHKVGIAQSTATFNSIISMGGKLGRADLVEDASQSIIQSGLHPNKITYRALLNAGGYLKDTDLIEDSWSQLVQLAMLASGNSDEPSFELRDWKALARACGRANHSAFARAQVSRFEKAMAESAFALVQRELDSDDGSDPTCSATLPRKTAEPEQISSLLADLAAVVSASTAQMQSAQPHDFYETPLPRGPCPSPTPPASYRELYEALTSDSTYPAAPPASAPVMKTVTGFPLAELRFEAWATVNELLTEAERNSEQRAEAVRDALRAGKPMARSSGKRKMSRLDRQLGVTWRQDDKSSSEEGSSESGEEWTDAVLRLRGLDRPEDRWFLHHK